MMNVKRVLTAALAIGLVFAVSVPVRAELLSHYKFDDNTLNSVVGSPDGTRRGDTGLPQYVSGMAGNALEFEESDYQAVDTTTSGYPLPTANAGTISFWAKTTQPGNATTGYGHFLSVANKTTAKKTLLQSLAFNKDHATTPGRIGLNMRSHQNHWYYLYTKSIGEGGITDWLDGEWHQIVFAWDTTDDATYQGAIYIDGVAQPLDAISSDAVLATDTFEVPMEYPVYIGAKGSYVTGEAHGYAQYPYDGALDDVQIYSEMLSASQVAWLNDNPGVAIPEPSTLAMLLCGLMVMFFIRRLI